MAGLFKYACNLIKNTQLEGLKAVLDIMSKISSFVFVIIKPVLNRSKNL